jgi:hypothetical protein
MRRSFLLKLAISVPLLVLLVALDGIAALQGLPLLLVALGIGLLLMEGLRLRLRNSGRANLAMLPFMMAALVLLFGFCRGRDLSQGLLLGITVAIVFDVLLVALALIGEASKRGARGVLEFVGVAAVGVALGFVLWPVLLLGAGRWTGASLAGP